MNVAGDTIETMSDGEILTKLIRSEVLIEEFSKNLLANVAALSQSIGDFRSDFKEFKVEHAKIHEDIEKRLRELEANQTKQKTIIGIGSFILATFAHWLFDTLKGK